MSKAYGPWHSSRLIYRAVEPSDEAFLHTVSNDADAFMNAAPFLPIPQSKKSSAQFREYLEKMLVSAIICLTPPKSTPESATEPSTEEDSTNAVPIGIIHLSAIPPAQIHHRRSRLGLNIIHAYQGQGYGSEAIKWALHWGFVYAQLHRIELGAFAYNEGALKLYERLGFVVEGRKREYLWREGRYWDLVEFGMLEQEWRGRYGRD